MLSREDDDKSTFYQSKPILIHLELLDIYFTRADYATNCNQFYHYMAYERNRIYILFCRSGTVGTVGEISKETFLLKSELIDKLDGLCREKNYTYAEDMETSCYHSNCYFAHPLIDHAHAITKSECSKKYAWTLPMTPEAAVRGYE